MTTAAAFIQLLRNQIELYKKILAREDLTPQQQDYWGMMLRIRMSELERNIGL